MGEIPGHVACLPLDLDKSWGLLGGNEEGWAEEMPTHMAFYPLDLGRGWALLGGDDEGLGRRALRRNNEWSKAARPANFSIVEARLVSFYMWPLFGPFGKVMRFL